MNRRRRQKKSREIRKEKGGCPGRIEGKNTRRGDRIRRKGWNGSGERG